MDGMDEGWREEMSGIEAKPVVWLMGVDVIGKV